MRTLYRYLTRTTRQHNLPRLKGRYRNEFDRGGLDADAELILLAGIARDEYEAGKLLTNANTTAPEFLKHLPKPKIDYWRRIRGWLNSIEGAYESDPHKEEYYQAKRMYGGRN